jgi:hypothetical protein
MTLLVGHIPWMAMRRAAAEGQKINYCGIRGPRGALSEGHFFSFCGMFPRFLAAPPFPDTAEIDFLPRKEPSPGLTPQCGSSPGGLPSAPTGRHPRADCASAPTGHPWLGCFVRVCSVFDIFVRDLQWPVFFLFMGAPLKPLKFQRKKIFISFA